MDTVGYHYPYRVNDCTHHKEGMTGGCWETRGLPEAPETSDRVFQREGMPMQSRTANSRASRRLQWTENLTPFCSQRILARRRTESVSQRENLGSFCAKSHAIAQMTV